jgi:dephospho-CoA kinase
MLRVGLTGGIGAGKSAVARRLAERGAVIVDADLLAREVVEPGTDGLAEIVEVFGTGVLTPDGALDRPALGARVFGDEAARRRLEKIIHPRVRERTAALTRSAAPDSIVVNDVPLLVETGLASSYHLVIVVMADREVRVERLTRLRGLSPAEAAARIDAQTDDASRRAAADVVLTNEDDLGSLHARVDALWRDRIMEFERNIRCGRSAPRSPEARIVPADPEWPVAAARLIARLRHGLGDGHDVQHVGPTAVPGRPARDLIDLMIGVRTLAEADGLAGRLGELGFPVRPGEWSERAGGGPAGAGGTWPKRVHGYADPGYRVDLHLRVVGSPGWRFALLMRDYLRAVPEGAEHADLARAADDWASSTGWQPS